jgi:L-ascorbate metabolism protein UlaG (beta-lactamase superfamily)
MPQYGCRTFKTPSYLFGEYLERAEPIYDYIFITHEHFDHCHPQTLRKLCRGERFKRLFVSPGCVDPARPIAERYGDAAFERDLPITKHIPEEVVQVLYPKYRNSQEGKDQSLPGPFEVDLGALRVETIESGESQRPDLPTCGYLIAHKEKRISFLHTGDLTVPYPALQGIRGQVDFFVHMKMGLTEWQGPQRSGNLLKFLDWVRPRFMIPIHHRTDRAAEPVPVGHWPPNVTDVAAFVEWIRETVGDRTQVLPFTAGVEYEVEMPAKRVAWKWNWRKSWTVPPWREG